MNRGMTMTSLLVAVALSGVIAVFGGRLVVNQMFMAATAELIDKGDAVMQFYVNALRDREVWRCTLFDDRNDSFRKFVLGNGGAVTGVSLRAPDCKELPLVAPAMVGGHEWNKHPKLTSSTGRSTVELLPNGSFKYIGDSIMAGTGQTDGWWKIKLEVAQAGGKGDVDLILKLCLQEDVFNAKHKGYKQVPRSYRYKCENYRQRHIRFSENAIQNDCGNRAIISVGDRTGAGIISVTCSSSSLLSFSTGSVDEHKLAPEGLSRPNDRQAIKPIAPSNRHPIVGTDGSGKLTIGTDRALLHSLGTGGSNPRTGETGGSECGYEYVNGSVRLDLVACGIMNNGTIRCCSRKGPKGPKGLKGCPASKFYAVKGCEPGNTLTCPTIPTSNPTCSSRQS